MAGTPSFRPMACPSVDLPELDGPQIMIRGPRLSSDGNDMPTSPKDKKAARRRP